MKHNWNPDNFRMVINKEIKEINKGVSEMKDEDKAEGFIGTTPGDCPGCEVCQQCFTYQGIPPYDALGDAGKSGIKPPKSPEQEEIELAVKGLREETIKILREELPGILKELILTGRLRIIDCVPPQLGVD